MIKLGDIYPKDFVEAVIKAWGDDPIMSGMLAEGNVDVGALLSREANATPTSQELVDAHRMGKLEDLVAQAERRLELRRLCAVWHDIIRPPRHGSGGSFY